jgi:hypothetical protein
MSDFGCLMLDALFGIWITGIGFYGIIVAAHFVRQQRSDLTLA